MFARSLHLSLIITLLVCPVMCQLGMCHCDVTPSATQTHEAENQTPACCAHCATKQTESDSIPVTPASPCDQETCNDCQGICGGAILTAVHQLDLFPDSVFIAESVMKDLAAVANSINCFRQHASEQRLLITGREIRCLQSTFLC